ncbi:DUF6602 domain-containing protein [Parendozoicomonas sp. Alg238-R29]|uniref:DUF6602 domain-containing protein n=1 Tax=Parendozoicomonas sp. Alg238-R29 TaxID=2993446 RepID=UPI00248D9D1C|nr:DUF6602 domain-containing protein [Parendozoicomonas sp. Alg238-R29]
MATKENMSTQKGNLVSEYFSSYSHELKSKMMRLDALIGRDHWLSVGNYKESLLRDLLASLLPKKFEVSTGFILSADEHGNEIKSKQQDIIIWDSSEYAAIFRDNDFVIIPPEACKAVIEVKSTLRKDTLKRALGASDEFFMFVNTPLSQNIDIKKYIFSFGSELKFPHDIYDTLSSFYNETKLNIDERIEHTSKLWPGDKSYSLFSIDGVFCLGLGAIIRDFRGFGDDVRFMFKAYHPNSPGKDTLYAFFEHEINRQINTFHSPGMYYAKQPGLLALMKNLDITPHAEKPLMVYPPVEEERMHDDINYTKVFVPTLP